jgi:hypothetical protein
MDFCSVAQIAVLKQSLWKLIWLHYFPSLWAYAFMVSICAGLIKGIVGFAMPMITISGSKPYPAP